MKPFHWIVVGVSLFGCASAPSTPDWVNGKSAKYPDNQYLCLLYTSPSPRDS